MHAQKYNPEVPTSESNDPSNSKIHLLNDKLINLRNMVLKPVRYFFFLIYCIQTHEDFMLIQITAHSSKMDSDKMLSDMAEGSGGNDYPTDPDSDDYGDGSGSGHSGKFFSLVFPKTNYLLTEMHFSQQNSIMVGDQPYSICQRPTSPQRVVLPRQPTH